MACFLQRFSSLDDFSLVHHNDFPLALVPRIREILRLTPIHDVFMDIGYKLVYTGVRFSLDAYP